jgi:hypothetical protein
MRFMISFRYRLILYAVVLFGAFFGIHSEARADCGIHAFETVSLPQLKHAEAIPLTAENVLSAHDYGEDPSLSKELAIISAVSPCNDETELRNATAQSLFLLYRDGLKARQDVAALKLIKVGKSTSSPACYPLIVAYTREQFVNHFTLDAFGYVLTGPDVAQEVQKRWAAIRGSSHFTHINGFWQNAFREAGMPYPPISPALTQWENGYMTAETNVRQHLPDGLQCREDPTFSRVR